ncbi:uncharacterized protein LOC135155842 [Lytechinus pictus]|uniref:uncharacterized protein LOC135155842 n=1 Tax=Lytechinus pictus TaxID=7653 RepID=UPI0030BA19D7
MNIKYSKMAAPLSYRRFLLLAKNVFSFSAYIGIIIAFVLSSSSYASDSKDVVGYNPTGPPELQFCTFFNNRAPEVQPDLKNCTWFRENSCCRQIEIDVTFRKMKSLPGASKQCQRYINYIMCYICSPRQYRFYFQQRLTVCEEFCDDLLEHCKTAMLKGSPIGDLYTQGKDFCTSRRMEIGKLEDGKCFYFNESMSDVQIGNKAARFAPNSYSFVLMFWVILMSNSFWR